MIELLAAVFIASLLGSLHCAGMCAPLVLLATGLESPGGAGRALNHAAYHGGRLLAYTLLGTIGGAVGATLDSGGSFVGAQGVAAVLAGVTMVLIGLGGFLRAVGMRLPQAPLPGVLRALLVAPQRAAMSLPPGRRAAAAGVLTGVLPCGWLYAFVVTAVGTGSPIRGAAVMAAFWAGTVPVLAIAGAGAQAVAGTLARRAPLVTSLAILVLGLYTAAGRALVPLAPPHAHEGAPGAHAPALEDPAARARQLDPRDASCCDDDP